MVMSLRSKWAGKAVPSRTGGRSAHPAPFYTPCYMLRVFHVELQADFFKDAANLVAIDNHCRSGRTCR
jgi:hypothetical protein